MRVRWLAASLTIGMATATAMAHAQAQAAGEVAQPSRCRLEGTHVSGVVAVDLGNGARAELPLVDASASVTLAQRPEDAVLEVTAPLVFRANYVPGERGGVGVHVARAYRSSDATTRLTADISVEARLAASGDHATLRVPLEWRNGALEIDVPCASLTAGAARVGTVAPRAPARGEFLRFAPSAVLRATADPSSPVVATLTRTNATDAVVVRGRLARPVGGYVRVSIVVGPIAVDAFVAADTVTSAGRELVPPGPPITSYSVASTLGDSERETVQVTLPGGTPVFADRRTQTPWATVGAPIRATLSRRAGSTARFALEFTHATFPTFPCRSDGVAGYPACGDAGALPRMGLMSCPTGSCTQVAYVDALAAGN